MITNKKFVYRNGYGKNGKASWLMKWQNRNSFTIIQASTALGVSTVSYRKYLGLGTDMPVIVVYAAKCIDEGITPWRVGDSLTEWRMHCGYSLSEVAILFNLSLPNIYKYNNGMLKLTVRWRLAMAYVCCNPPSKG